MYVTVLINKIKTDTVATDNNKYIIITYSYFTWSLNEHEWTLYGK